MRAATEVPERLEYQPALDGIRALAVIAVIAFHNSQGVGRGRGGFLGVDVFFVLSGFLITSLLLIDHAHKGKVVSGAFWARRARRLLPALLVLLAIQALVAVFLAKPWELHAIRDGSLATLLYVYNYWTLGAHTGGTSLVLGHTWSLAIEEQFYLIWPVLLALILYLARGSRAVILTTLVSLCAISVGVMAWIYSPKNPYPAYISLQARAQTLLVGAILAFLLLRRPRVESRAGRVALECAGIAALVWLALLCVTVNFFTARWVFDGGYLGIAIATAALIAAAIQPASPVLGRLLSVRVLVGIGLISYGLYLFHVPVFRVLNAQRVGFGGGRLLLVRLAVVVPLALASYFLVEMPIRRGALTRPRLAVVAPAVALALVAFLAFATVRSRDVTSDELMALSYGRTAAVVPDGSAKVLVAGNDSIVAGLGGVPYGRFVADGIAGTTASIYACSIISGAEVAAQRAVCPRWPTVFGNAVDGYRPDASVLSIGGSELFDRVEDGRRLVVGTPAFETYMLVQLERARTVLTERGAPLVLLTAPCDADPVRTGWLNGVLRRFADEHADSVHLADYGRFFCPDGSHPRTFRGQPAVAANGVSLTPAAALATWQWLAHEPTIAALSRDRGGNP